jgi:hypothetical protein
LRRNAPVSARNIVGAEKQLGRERSIGGHLLQEKEHLLVKKCVAGQPALAKLSPDLPGSELLAVL